MWLLDPQIQPLAVTEGGVGGLRFVAAGPSHPVASRPPQPKPWEASVRRGGGSAETFNTHSDEWRRRRRQKEFTGEGVSVGGGGGGIIKREAGGWSRKRIRGGGQMMWCWKPERPLEARLRCHGNRRESAPVSPGLQHVCTHGHARRTPARRRIFLRVSVVGIQCRQASVCTRAWDAPVHAHTHTRCLTIAVSTAGFIFSKWHLYNQGDTGGK